MNVQITFYAAAADAAGVATIGIPDAGITPGELIGELSGRNARLGEVLAYCSLLVNGVAVTDWEQQLPAGARVDVLPPFAGG